MAKCPEGRAVRGSQRWLQDLVNDCPNLLDAAIQRATDEISEPIRWVSPLAGDNFREYRDGAFLEKSGVSLDCVPLKKFWPRRGPCWDALGRTDGGQIILLEAKAHIGEMDSSPSGAGEKSLPLIRESLESVKSYVGADSDIDWTTTQYQHANRLAHLYLLRTLNEIPAFLVDLHFLNADDMDYGKRVIPKTVEGWENAISCQERDLGIPSQHALSQYSVRAFADVNEIRQALGA